MLLVTLVSRQSENMPTIDHPAPLSLEVNIENGTIACAAASINGD